MSIPTVIRIFFAIELPASVKQTIGQFVACLKKKSKSKAIRWTQIENLHITLQFLGEIERDAVSPLVANVKNQMEHFAKVSAFTLGSMHLFPTPYRPRVIALDVVPQEDLAAIATSIGKGIMLSNYQVENRPFHAHVTLGRIKYPDANLDFLSELSLPRTEQIVVNEIVLFRSDPQPSGSIYTVIERINLMTKALAS